MGFFVEKDLQLQPKRRNTLPPTAKNLIKKKYFYPMAPVHLEPRHKIDSMDSGNNRGQRGFGLTPICLGSRPEAK